MSATSQPNVDDPPIYELRSSRDLPSINFTKKLHHVWLPPQSCLWIVIRLLNRLPLLIPFGYCTGVLAAVAVLFLQSPSTPLAVYALIVQIVSTYLVLLELHYDLARLATKTFEFWFMSIVNIASTGLVIFCLGNVRSLGVIGNAFVFEFVLLMDASHHNTRVAAFMTLSTMIFFGLLTVAISLDWVEVRHDRVLWQSAIYTLDAGDVAANGLSTLIVLLLPNAARKFLGKLKNRLLRIRRDDYSDGSTMCVTYRSCLRLASTKSPPSTATVVGVPVKPTSVSTVTRLKLVPINGQFAADNVVAPRFRRLLHRPFIQRRGISVLQVFGVIGILSMPAAAIIPVPNAQKLFAIVTFVSTFIHCTTYWLVAQRQLLLRALVCFDNLFFSLQVVCCSLTMCDLNSYDIRCLVSVSVTLWIHWLISLDAITPDMKRCLKWRHRFTTLVVFVFVAQHLLLAVFLMFRDGEGFRDRVIITIRFNGFEKEIRGVVFMFDRMATALAWSSLLYWRLRNRQEGGLLMLQAEVFFEHPGTASTSALIVPLQTSPDT
ncbi:hypothetical protein Poli38472_001990 [Pythium oligandrum]|uniref:Uncharacterized protein n=1 Tax=Pythium oligandrum TaxID=41045 RepID=A0A8K1CUM1_PYTOL|nr:hypothetical protein Poli38472_001990 [Pythium oligandrum]|eukprot:TMW69834.1 hypothetical protein Poli38472_001990 [Pythium oligandrum]